MFRSRFVRYALPLTVTVAALLGFVYWQAAESRRSELQQTEEKYVALLSEALADDFSAIITDLMVLESVAFRAATTSIAATTTASVTATEGTDATSATPPDAPIGISRHQLAESFRQFVEKKRVYDQIRFLDLSGMEVVRVNYQERDGSGVIVTDDELQQKQDRYYFQAALQLRPGQVFVSPFDLNVEDGQIEMPIKPTIRFAMPVVDAQGRKSGILVLNYLGREMLNRFARLDADSPGHAMLINSDGYWLYDAGSSREWAFMYPDRQQLSVPATNGQLWQTLATQDKNSISLPQGMFTFTSVQPFHFDHDLNVATLDSAQSTGLDRRWYVVSFLSNESLAAHLAALRNTMATVAMLLITAVLGVSAILSRYATEREESRRALRVSESRFRQMADSIAEVFWMSNVDRDQFIYVSPAFGKIWGVPLQSPADAYTQWQNAIHADDRDTVLHARRNAIAADGFSLQYRIVRPDGAQRWIWDQGFAVRDEAQRVTGFAGIAEDITDLKETQIQLLQNERLAAVGEAITGLAHESRNALQRSQSCLEMLTKRVADRPEAADLLQRTQLALRDLHYLYEHVRNYAAPLQLDFATCDLQAIWQQTCDDLSELIASRAARIETCSTTRDFQVVVDATAFRQVLRNIIENALAADLDASADRDHIKLEVTWRDVTLGNRDGVEIAVCDNGPGFRDGNCDRIFEPFFTTKTRGTGLGMAISRRIILAHGGNIYAEPGNCGGLRVVVQLPRTM